jgi:hypothetical protein
MKQFTTEEAIAFAKSEIWKTWNHEQIVRLQLFQDKLCVPFDKFHEAIESVLGRPVWTHEFASNNIKEEYLGTRPAPTFEEIIDLIPKDKRIIIF